MHHEVRVHADAEAVARAGAAYLAERVRAATESNERAHLAVSGGRTPWIMLRALAAHDLDWTRVRVYQVDERVAPAGDADRNLSNIVEALHPTAAELVPMPVDEEDLEAAADRYAAGLPVQFAVVHLGLGADGHTASLVPGDPVLDVADRLVATTQPYQGRRRMTLTYPALARADQLLWIVTGADKRDALAALLSGNRDIPAGRVDAAASLVLADEAATAP